MDNPRQFGLNKVIALLVQMQQAAPILIISTLLILAFHTPAQAVPGHAWTSRNINVYSTSCPSFVAEAVKTITSADPDVDSLNVQAYMIRGYVPYTGVLVYCMPNGGRCGSTVSIVALSDKGSQEATIRRDQVNTALGDPSNCP